MRVGAINVIAFFIGYFLLLSFHLFPVGEIPATALDRLTAFQPGALLLFLSLYLYVPKRGVRPGKFEIFFEASRAFATAGARKLN